MKITLTAILTGHAIRDSRRFRLALACGGLLPTAAALWLSSAHAQTPAPAVPAAATASATAPAVPLQVGDATRNLLEKQRAGTMASDTPRPIAGEVAQRSYERYLRSFERPIPESFTAVASPAGKAGK